jgi:hypothetical protein
MRDLMIMTNSFSFVLADTDPAEVDVERHRDDIADTISSLGETSPISWTGFWSRAHDGWKAAADTDAIFDKLEMVSVRAAVAIHRLLAGNTEQNGYWVVARQSDEGVVYLNGWDKAGLDGKREASWTLNASDARSSGHPGRGRKVAEGVLVVRQRSSPHKASNARRHQASPDGRPHRNRSGRHDQ